MTTAKDVTRRLLLQPAERLLASQNCGRGVWRHLRSGPLQETWATVRLFERRKSVIAGNVMSKLPLTLHCGESIALQAAPSSSACCCPMSCRLARALRLPKRVLATHDNGDGTLMMEGQQVQQAS